MIDSEIIELNHFGSDQVINPSEITKIFFWQELDNLYCTLTSHGKPELITDIFVIKLAKKFQIQRVIDNLIRDWKILDPTTIHLSLTGLSTLIPKDFYEKKSEYNYLTLNSYSFKKELHTCNRDYIEWISAYNIFYQTTNNYTALKQHFPTLKISNSTSLLLKLIPILRAKVKISFVVEILNKKINICVINDQSELLFCNNFSYDNSNDLLYFTLAVYKQYSSVLKSPKVHILHIPENTEEYLTKVKEYIEDVEIIIPTKDYTSPNIDEVLLHKFNTLILHSICA